MRPALKIVFKHLTVFLYTIRALLLRYQIIDFHSFTFFIRSCFWKKQKNNIGPNIFRSITSLTFQRVGSIGSLLFQGGWADSWAYICIEVELDIIPLNSNRLKKLFAFFKILYMYMLSQNTYSKKKVVKWQTWRTRTGSTKFCIITK